MKPSIFRGYFALAFLLIANSLSFAAETPPSPRIHFIAGPDSHAVDQHEFIAGCHLLGNAFKSVFPNTKFEVSVGWPTVEKQVEFIKSAQLIVIYCDGYTKHQLNNHYDEMERLMKAGASLGLLHCGCEVDSVTKGDALRRWTGGAYEKFYSVNPTWTCTSIYNPKHPVARGCKEFTLKDEFYFNIRFSDTLPWQSVLKGKPDDRARRTPNWPKGEFKHVIANSGREETLMWTLERKDGGRGFGFTGGHYHHNWLNDDFRKLVINAFAWSLRREIPQQGIVTKTPTSDEMTANTSRFREKR